MLRLAAIQYVYPGVLELWTSSNTTQTKVSTAISESAMTNDTSNKASLEQELAALREQVTELEHENSLLRQQATLIKGLEESLSELSTPLIPLADGVIIMPLIGTIDPERALQVMETLLDGIGQYQADIAILDITGVRTIDTQVASALVRTAQAARLLGAQVMLSGISAEVAQTLVHLGADLGDITTQSNLHSSLMEVFGTDMRRDTSTSLFTT